MAPAPLATPSELATWLRASFSADDDAWAELVLSAVSSLVRSAAGQTWETGDVPDTARVVTLEVAARVYRNPEAATSYNLSTGPFGKAITFANPRAVGLYLSADDKAALGIRARPALYTLATTRQDVGCGTTFVPVEGAPPFPWYGDDVVI